MSVVHHQLTVNKEQSGEFTHLASRAFDRMREQLEQDVLRLCHLVPHGEMYIHFYAQYIPLPLPSKYENLNSHNAKKKQEKQSQLDSSTDMDGEDRDDDFIVDTASSIMDGVDNDMHPRDASGLDADAKSHDEQTAHDSDDEDDDHTGGSEKFSSPWREQETANRSNERGISSHSRDRGVSCAVSNEDSRSQGQASCSEDDGWPDLERYSSRTQDSLWNIEVNTESDANHDTSGLEDLASSSDDDSLIDDLYDNTSGQLESPDTSDDEASSDWTEYTVEEMAMNSHDSDPFDSMNNLKQQDTSEEITSVDAPTEPGALNCTAPQADLPSSALDNKPPESERIFFRVKQPLPPIPPHGLRPYTPGNPRDRQIFADYLSALCNLATTLRIATALRARRERIKAQGREAKLRWDYRYEAQDPVTGAVVYLDTPRSVRKDCGRRSQLHRVYRPEEFDEWGCYIRSHLDVKW